MGLWGVVCGVGFGLGGWGRFLVLPTRVGMLLLLFLLMFLCWLKRI